MTHGSGCMYRFLCGLQPASLCHLQVTYRSDCPSQAWVSLALKRWKFQGLSFSILVSFSLWSAACESVPFSGNVSLRRSSQAWASLALKRLNFEGLSFSLHESQVS